MDRTSPAYQTLFDATVPDNFAFLPNEVVYDVVGALGVRINLLFYELANLAKIKGSWGMCARELSVCTTQYNKGASKHGVTFRSRTIDHATGCITEEEISFAEAQNRLICDSTIDDWFDLDRLMAVAPKLYDSIHLSKIPHYYRKALGLMETQFTKITWSGGNPNEAATPELIDFLRRQLRSIYLRDLTVFSVNIENGALDEPMEVFVKRPSFECLWMGAGTYLVPFQIFKEAHKTWEAPGAVGLTDRSLYAESPKESATKLAEYFRTTFEFSTGALTFIRNFRRGLQTRLTMYEEEDCHNIQMICSSL